jgi:hypothetical protein
MITWNVELGTWDVEHLTSPNMPKFDPDTLKIPAFMRKKMKKKAVGRRQKAEPGRQKIESREQRADSRTPKISNLQGRPPVGAQKSKKPAFSKLPTANSVAKLIPIGTLTHYLDNLEVGIIQLDGTLKVGDTIQLTAENFLFQQPVDSMQINRKPVKSAKKGADIGLKLVEKPKVGTKVFKAV